MNFTGHCGPAKQGRCRASKATNNDVLWRRTFQEHGVNKGIADQTRHRQNSGQHIHRGSKQRGTKNRKQCCKGNRFRLADPPLCDGAIRGAGHLLINTLVDHMVDCRRCTCTKGNANIAQNQRLPRHKAWDRHTHANDGGYEHQSNDARLCQLKKIRPAR